MNVNPLPKISGLPSDRSPLAMVHFADLHSYYQEFPQLLSRLKTIVAREARNRPVLIVLNGDLFEGSDVVAERSKGKLDWEFLADLRKLAPVLVNLGNHEFDFATPSDYLRKARDLGLMVVGTLACRKSGLCLAPGMVQVAGLGLIGLSVADMNTYPVSAQRQVIALDSRKKLLQMLSLAHAEGLTPFLVSHAGLDMDAKLLPILPPATHVFGAHNHLLFQVQLDGGGSYRHQGFHGELITVTRLDWSGTVPVYEFVDYTEFDESVDLDWREKVLCLREEFLNADDLRIIAYNPEPIPYHRAAQWVAGQLLRAVDVDAAVINHTSLGGGLPKGPISQYRFDAFLRFDNQLMIARVKGRELRKIQDKASEEQANPLACGRGDLLYGAFPEKICSEEMYRLLTTDWIADQVNQKQYLSIQNINFEETPWFLKKAIRGGFPMVPVD